MTANISKARSNFSQGDETFSAFGGKGSISNTQQRFKGKQQWKNFGEFGQKKGRDS